MICKAQRLFLCAILLRRNLNLKLAIVTGVSKGLGKATATFLLESGIHVYGISRTDNKHLSKVAQEHGVTFIHLPCDLGDLENIDKVLKEIKSMISEHDLHQLYIVNNAAVINPIDQAVNTNGQDLTYHYQVNVIAPMMLTNTLLKRCNKEKIPFIGVNITSGAKNRPIYGWSAYCSSKASLNMYTKAIALEQEELQTGNKIIAFSPGVMDTDMQAEIRASDYDRFIDVDTFKNYKKQNLLSDTEAVASVLVDIMVDEVGIQNGRIYDVKEYF